MCGLENNAIRIKCDDKDSKPSIVEDIPCPDQNESTRPNNATDEPTPYIPAECEYTPASENTTPESTSVVKNDRHSTSNSSNLTITAALGALVGLLLVLLVAVTAALTWTCWLLKKWKGIKCNSEYQLRYVKMHVQN